MNKQRKMCVLLSIFWCCCCFIPCSCCSRACSLYFFAFAVFIWPEISKYNNGSSQATGPVCVCNSSTHFTKGEYFRHSRLLLRHKPLNKLWKNLYMAGESVPNLFTKTVYENMNRTSKNKWKDVAYATEQAVRCSSVFGLRKKMNKPQSITRENVRQRWWRLLYNLMFIFNDAQTTMTKLWHLFLPSSLDLVSWSRRARPFVRPSIYRPNDILRK